MRLAVPAPGWRPPPVTARPIELVGWDVEVGDGDDQMVDAGDHAPILAPGPGRHPLGSWGDAGPG